VGRALDCFAALKEAVKAFMRTPPPKKKPKKKKKHE